MHRLQRGSRAAFVVVSVVTNLAVLATVSVAQVPPTPDATAKIQKREPTRFVRVVRDEYESPTALQTATVKYVRRDAAGNVALEVFLESVVHIADRAYFRECNRRFTHYDSVLYELVAPAERQRPDPAEDRESLVRFVQELLAGGLGFAYQLDEIDYKASNLVHADLSPTEIAESIRRRGDDQIALLTEFLLQVLRQRPVDTAKPPAESTPESVAVDLGFFVDPKGATKLRRLLATALDKSSSLEAQLPPASRAMLITDRNERAMQVFQKQLDVGNRRIALFWGAAHMEDFERRLILDYGLQPAGVTWRTAWDLRDGAVERAPIEIILEKIIRRAVRDRGDELPDSQPGPEL